MDHTVNLISECVWPDLPTPYSEALHEAVDFILRRFEDTIGIIVSGTIIRGHPAPSSDLDIYVIREKLQRQRIQKFFNGIPAEIFVNPAKKVQDYFLREHKAARPITAHMLATGFVILKRAPVVDELCQQAKTYLSRIPDFDALHLTTMRYMAATRYEDATDIAADRPEAAFMILNLAIHSMLQYRFCVARRHIPRDKDLLLALQDLDAELAHLAYEFYQVKTFNERLALAEKIAEHTIQTCGFFEWESTLEDVT